MNSYATSSVHFFLFLLLYQINSFKNFFKKRIKINKLFRKIFFNFDNRRSKRVENHKK